MRGILVADDLDSVSTAARRRSAAVLKLARSLGRRFSKPVHLVFVEDDWHFPDMKAADQDLFANWRGAHKKALDAHRRTLGMRGRNLLLTGQPAHGILKVLRSRPVPDLAVLGTQGRKGLDRLLLGSVAEEVLRRSTRPVMVLGPLAQGRGGALPTRGRLSLLVATDLTENSLPAERFALQLALKIRAKVTLFHCLGDPVWAYPGAFGGPEGVGFDVGNLTQEFELQARRALARKARAFRGRGVACKAKLLGWNSHANRETWREAARGHHLVVMGTHGRTLLLRTFFGSVARETILKSPVPVVTVHSRS